MSTMKHIPHFLSALLLVLAASCAGNRQLDGSKSPFVEEELPVLKENMAGPKAPELLRTCRWPLR